MNVGYVSLRLAAADSEVERKYTKAEIVAAGTDVGMKVLVEKAFRLIEDEETFSRTAALQILLLKGNIDREECQQVIARLEVGVSQGDDSYLEVVRWGVVSDVVLVVAAATAQTPPDAASISFGTSHCLFPPYLARDAARRAAVHFGSSTQQRHRRRHSASLLRALVPVSPPPLLLLQLPAYPMTPQKM